MTAETQIIAAINRQEAGAKVSDISREMGVSEATFYHWKAKYGGMDASQLKRLKDLEAENSRLLFSRRIVGWSMAPTLERTLVMAALQMAIMIRTPAEGLMHHSDRGSQYASYDYQKMLQPGAGRKRK